jgi:hypothetical protein
MQNSSSSEQNLQNKTLITAALPALSLLLLQQMVLPVVAVEAAVATA